MSLYKKTWYDVDVQDLLPENKAPNSFRVVVIERKECPHANRFGRCLFCRSAKVVYEFNVHLDGSPEAMQIFAAWYENVQEGIDQEKCQIEEWRRRANLQSSYHRDDSFLGNFNDSYNRPNNGSASGFFDLPNNGRPNVHVTSLFSNSFIQNAVNLPVHAGINVSDLSVPGPDANPLDDVPQPNPNPLDDFPEPDPTPLNGFPEPDPNPLDDVPESDADPLLDDSSFDHF